MKTAKTNSREEIVVESLIDPKTRETAATACNKHGLKVEMFANPEMADSFASCISGHFADFNGAGYFRQHVAKGKTADEIDKAAAEIVADWKKREAAKPNGLPPATRLADFPKPTPDERNPAALLRDRYLRKGGGLVIVAPSGVGKSTFTTGATSYWAAGRDFCGIRPAHPLKIGVFQTEDDADEMGEFRDDLLRQLADDNFTPDETELAMSVSYEPVPPKSGQDFCEHLKAVQAERHYDMIVLNPLWAFIGGDMTKNADLGAFLRHGIDPILKDANLCCGMVIIHHTNKLKVDNRGKIDLGTTEAYAGAGGAELTNWARAVLVLQEIRQATPREFYLVAAKRGTRLGWTDAEGKPTTRRKISHSSSGIFWIDGGGIFATNGTKDQDGEKIEKNKREVEDFRKAAIELAEQHGSRDPIATEVFKVALKKLPGGGAIGDKKRDEYFNALIAEGVIVRQPELRRDPKTGAIGPKARKSGGRVFVMTPEAAKEYRETFEGLAI